MIIDITELIVWKEKRLQLTKKLLRLLKSYPCNTEHISELEEEIKDLEKSIEEDRKIQLAEVKISGRREWWHHPVLYFVIYFGGIITVKVAEFILSKL